MRRSSGLRRTAEFAALHLLSRVRHAGGGLSNCDGEDKLRTIKVQMTLNTSITVTNWSQEATPAVCLGWQLASWTISKAFLPFCWSS
jgi:hypothetical protein